MYVLVFVCIEPEALIVVNPAGLAVMIPAPLFNVNVPVPDDTTNTLQSIFEPSKTDKVGVPVLPIAKLLSN